ncbi:hypothetical protein NIES4073_28150 [Kalymmatonema gypsitolerans NIES-4073]|nr:hypothetical protein NIES4073_28150 [Scytonema sp. NIES-4073]
MVTSVTKTVLRSQRPAEETPVEATNVAEYSVLGVSSIKLTKLFSGKLFKTFLRGINEY